MSSGKEGDAFTVIWTLENFSCSIENRWYHSPFIPSKSNTNFKYHFSLKRNYSKNGECLTFVWAKDLCCLGPSDKSWPENILDLEISLFASDGSFFICKERKQENYKKPVKIHNVFVPKLRKYLSGDILTVVCVLWNGGKTLLDSERIFARTRIGVEHVSFVWSIKDFSSLQPFEERFFDLKEKVKQAGGCRFVFHLDDRNSMFINTTDQDFLKKLRVSILDLRGNAVEFSENENKLHRFLLFLYAGDFDGEMRWEDASALYSTAADKYELLALQKHCLSSIKSSLSVSNALEALDLAETHFDDDLKEYVRNFIFTNIHEVVFFKEWEEFIKRKSDLAFETLNYMFKRKLGIKN